MRTVLYCAMSMSVIVLAWWAYKENYVTQERQDTVDEMRSEISDRFYYLQYLRAEWAYLSRAERLIALVEDNFDQVMLGPMTKVNLAKLETIPHAEGRSTPVGILTLPDPAAIIHGFQPR